MNNKQKVVVTGASGYVGSYITPILREQFDVLAIDKVDSADELVRTFDLAANIRLGETLREFAGDQPLTIVHLAAARFDFGAPATAYYRDNVVATKALLAALENVSIQQLVHISSVAAIDGANLEYKDDLGTDDAYRVTKFLQEESIRRYAEGSGIPFRILAPSAIFSNELRSDTNIGTLQKLARLSSVLPKVPVRKSLTYLPAFSAFIIDAINEEIAVGRYLTIERPVLEVTEIVHSLSQKKIRFIRVPGLKYFLSALSWILYLISGFGRIDLKLTPNRIKKLFKDTSYEADYGYDSAVYNERYAQPQDEILKSLYEQ